ncbi:MAG: ribonuclease J [Pseudomonadota bacterium]|nr:ribonuclease J [Pseudomonadota bacterium]MEC7496380.1 ribonuclease J [Pseudomonadota bacterium]MEC7981786.1 ribonuclease J [Pseudomonadota bacterium]MEC8270047.1 ribonuclease J [Pseudomonadota bacterium]MEE3023841.1 ribonuclease J [Pseudomonadota bacterium]
MYKASDLLFVPLGGSGEIGMNANLYHYDGSWLMVDLGISFPDDSMPGIDVVLPDLSFIEQRRDSLAGLVLTHGHEDHLGAIPYMWSRLRCPIYGSAFTLALLRRKLSENGNQDDIPLIEISPGTVTEVGAFSVEMVGLTHSIPDPTALAIRCDAGTVLHTGDWKFDAAPGLGNQTDTERLAQIGDEGVLAMVGDSTNAMVEGRTGSEADAEAGLRDVIAAAKGRVAVTCFSSNVARFQSIVRAAQASDRSVAVVGRAIKRAISAAQEVGYLRDLPDFVREEDIDLLPRDNLVIICTGTQGEPRAAMAKIAAGVHESVTLEQGDTVIYSSRQIPGNEPAIAKVQDALIRRRINLVTDDDAPVHVSGHPSRDEMVEMYGLVKPRIAIPVHGTARHLVAHAELAETCQVRQTLLPDNGTVIRLAGKGGDSEAEIIDNVKTGALTHEKGKIVEIQSDMMRARRRMLWNGVVTTSLVMNRSGALCAVPAVSQTGIGDEAAAADYIATASIAVEDALSGMTRNARRDDGSVEEIAGQALRRVARSMFGLRPIVHVHVMRLDDGDLQGVA